MKSYLDKLPSPFFVLAPMDDVTDTVFRQIVSVCAPPDLYFTEFVNVDGLQSPGRQALLRRLQFTDKEQPLIAQIWGCNPENYRKTAKELVEMGFAGVDINMGCPVKTVIKNGACAALINNQALAAEIIQATKSGLAGKIPLSVKTRIGFRDYDPAWIKFLMEQKLNMLTIHLRTAREMSKVPAHWNMLPEIKAMRDTLSPDTLLVGNGDVMNRADAAELTHTYGIDGVMIGRGIFQDPFAFAERSPWSELTPQEKAELYKKHVTLFAQTWKDADRRVRILGKFCKIYINGFDNASERRDQLMHCTSTAELLRILSSPSGHSG